MLLSSPGIEAQAEVSKKSRIEENSEIGVGGIAHNSNIGSVILWSAEGQRANEAGRHGEEEA